MASTLAMPSAVSIRSSKPIFFSRFLYCSIWVTSMSGVPQDVYAIDMLVTQIEQYKKREKKIGFELLIETALGMANVEAIAQSSKRVEAMSFGVADYAASTRARTMGIGAPHPDYGILS